MTKPLPEYLPRKFQRIHLELTNRCNFSCLFCPDAKMSRSRAFIDEDLARSALDQIAELDIAEKITFHVMGEPLLHPRFFQILDHALDRRLKVGLTTNGALLKPQTIEALAARDIHQIDISLQSPDEESFRATRGSRIDFDKYCRRILDLLAACSAKDKRPIFKIRMMTTRFAKRMRDQLGIPDFMGTGRDLRNTVLDWTERIYDRLALDGDARKKLPERVRRISIFRWNVIEVSPGIFIETYVLSNWANAFSDEEIIEARYGYCFGMRDHFAILCNGDVVLCCIDFDGKTVVGTLVDSTLDQILRGPLLEPIVKGFRTARLVHPYCRRCLGSKSVLGSWTKPVLSVLGLKVLKPWFYRKYKLYE
ncbi:MAG: radical SAM/SPASM domain-containing protein [Thermodesulfobacteriota bacterium]